MSVSSLENLIATLAGAITSAQDQVEQHYISLLRKYFDDQGRPLSLKIELPATSSRSSVGESREVVVPVLALVESRALGISSVEVTLDVVLSGIASPPAPAAAPGSAPAARRAAAPMDFLAASLDPDVEAPAAQARESPRPAAPPAPVMNIELPAARGKGPTARLVMRVEQRPPSDALTRLVNKLNTLI